MDNKIIRIWNVEWFGIWCRFFFSSSIHSKRIDFQNIHHFVMFHNIINLIRYWNSHLLLIQCKWDRAYYFALWSEYWCIIINACIDRQWHELRRYFVLRFYNLFFSIHCTVIVRGRRTTEIESCRSTPSDLACMQATFVINKWYHWFQFCPIWSFFSLLNVNLWQQNNGCLHSLK